MVELFIELIADILFEASYETALSKKAPRWLHIMLLIFILLFFVGILCIFLILGIGLIKKNESIQGILSIVFGFIFSGLLLRGLLKDLKERRSKIN